MKKSILLILILALSLSIFSGCGQGTAGKPTEPPVAESSASTDTPVVESAAPTADEPMTDDVVIRIGALTGPTAIGMAKLLTDSDNGTAAGNYSYTLAGSADELKPLLLQSELDVAALPVNLASVLYGKTEGQLQIACINTLGVLYIVEKGGESIKNFADIKGKTIYATGKGSTPEYTLRYILAQNGVDPDKDVTIEWKSEPAEVVTLMSNEETSIAMIPQPYVEVALGKLEGARVALSLNDAWAALDNGSLLVTAGLVVRADFAKEHPEALAAFLAEYEASTKWVNENVADAALLCEQLGIVKAAIAEKAIPACNVTYIAGTEMKTALSGFLAILHELNPASIGGALPGDDFYFGCE